MIQERIPLWRLPPMVERIYSPRSPGSIRTLNWLTGRCWAEQIAAKINAKALAQRRTGE